MLSDEIYQFNTEIISLTKLYPDSGIHSLSPVMIATFDQAVNRDDFSKITKCFVHGPLGIKKLHSGITVLSEKEANSDRGIIKFLLQHEKEDHFVIFTTAKPFPYDSIVSIEVGPDIPSAEGPLTSPLKHHATFNTIEPFAVTCMIADLKNTN